MFYNHNFNRCASAGLTTYFPQGTLMFTLHRRNIQHHSKKHPNLSKTAFNTMVKQKRKGTMPNVGQAVWWFSEAFDSPSPSSPVKCYSNTKQAFSSPWKLQKAPKEENWKAGRSFHRLGGFSCFFSKTL